MNIKKAKEDFNLTDKELQDLDIDIVQLVTDREFKRRTPAGDNGDYRERVIDKLIAANVAWGANINLTHETVKRIIQVICPYSKHVMEVKGGGGNGDSTHIDYVCPVCKARVILSLPSEGGFTWSRTRIKCLASTN